MPPERLRVAVVGAGTAGPAAALLLARDGHAVDLFEAFAEPLPLGAGILLQPTGLDVLGELGLRERILAVGSRVTRVYGETVARRPVLDVRYSDVERPGLEGLGIHRGALFMALFEQLEPAGVRLRLGAPVERLQSRHVVVRGTREGPYDLIAIADGARSTLRAQTGIEVSVRRYPYGAVWGIAPGDGDAYGDTLWQAYEGTAAMVGTLPTGRSTGGLADRTSAAFGAEAPMTSIFWSVRDAEARAFIARPRAQLIDECAAVSPHLAELAAHLQGELTQATYWDVRMPRYHAHGVVVLGDAAHAMSPQLGQGANLALLDASTLAACLREAGLERGLELHSARRRAHNRFYQFASRWLTPLFQSGLEWMAPPRDQLLHPLTRSRWARRQMALTLAGLKTGLLRELR